VNLTIFTSYGARNPQS